MEAEHLRSHTRLFVGVALMATDIEYATLRLLRWAGACRLKVDRAHIKSAKENFWKLVCCSMAAPLRYRISSSMLFRESARYARRS